MDFFDNHCDTALYLLETRGDLQRSDGHVSLKKAAYFDRWAQVFALFVDDGKSGSEAFMQYIRERDCLFAQLEKHKNSIVQCRTAKQIDAAFASGKRAAILSVENGAALGGSLDRLMQFQQDGVKLLTLTWFGENALGGGSEVGGALKPFGREVVRVLPQYGIVPDISHLSDEGVAEVFELYDGALIASHSNVRHITGHYRNLTRAQIIEICRRKGFIGVNFEVIFLNRNADSACWEDIYRHIEAFLELGAQDALGFGSDFDGAHVPQDVGDIGGVSALREFLLRKNYSEALLQKLFFENASAFWHRQLGEEIE